MASREVLRRSEVGKGATICERAGMIEVSLDGGVEFVAGMLNSEVVYDSESVLSPLELQNRRSRKMGHTNRLGMEGRVEHNRGNG